MKRAPTLAAIRVAELKVVQSKRNTREALDRARIALRSRLAKPSTLALVAGAAGVLGYVAGRPIRSEVSSGAGAAGAAATTSAAGLGFALLWRYALRRLPDIIRFYHSARQRHPGAESPIRSPAS